VKCQSVAKPKHCPCRGNHSCPPPHDHCKLATELCIYLYNYIYIYDRKRSCWLPPLLRYGFKVDPSDCCAAQGMRDVVLSIRH
jgi:hypothetical protein